MVKTFTMKNVKVLGDNDELTKVENKRFRSRGTPRNDEKKTFVSFATQWKKSSWYTLFSKNGTGDNTPTSPPRR